MEEKLSTYRKLLQNRLEKIMQVNFWTLQQSHIWLDFQIHPDRTESMFLISFKRTQAVDRIHNVIYAAIVKGYKHCSVKVYPDKSCVSVNVKLQ